MPTSKKTYTFIDVLTDFIPVYRPLDSWITIVLVALFLLLAFLRQKYPRRFAELIVLPINDKYFALEGRFPDAKHPFNILLLFCQIMAFSLALYLWGRDTGAPYDHGHSWSYTQVLLTISSFLVLRYALGFITSKVLKLESILAPYRYERMSYHHVISLILLIFITIIEYFPGDTSGVFTWLPWYLLLAFTLATISSVRRNSMYLFKNSFYFILYLCALEIAPYVLLFEVLKT